MKEKLLELFKKLGIDLGDKAEEIEKGLEEITKPATPPTTPTPPTSKPTEVDGEKDKTILALTEQVTSLTDLVGEMKKDRDASVAAQKEKLEKEKLEKIESLKKKGIESGKITDATWEAKFKAIAEKDTDAFETILEDLAIDPHFDGQGKTGSKEDRYGADSYVGPLKGADSTIMDSINKMNQN